MKTNIIGLKFGRLTVICKSQIKGHSNRRKYECVCDCGKVSFVLPQSLKDGNTISCGCYRVDLIKATKTKPYDLKSPEYRAWQNMKNRCYRPCNNQYHNYGKRGIVVCEEWKRSFENFISDMGHRPSSQYSLDRKDNEKDYNKDNCRWATLKEQNFNKRTNIVFENGMTLPDFLSNFKITYPRYKYLRYIKKLTNTEIFKQLNK